MPTPAPSEPQTIPEAVEFDGDPFCVECGRAVAPTPNGVPVCCDYQLLEDGSHDAPVCMLCCHCPSSIRYRELAAGEVSV